MKKNILHDFCSFDGIEETDSVVRIKGTLKVWNKTNYNQRWYADDCIKEFLEDYLSKKNLTLNYQHKEDLLIGKFIDLQNDSKRLYGVAELDKIPFVETTVIPQIKSKTLQGFSTEILTIKSDYIKENDIWIEKIYKGAMCGCAIVGMPADINSKLDNIGQPETVKKRKRFFYY
jgi:hypothetical protein